MSSKKNLNTRAQIRAIFGVAALSFRIAPGAVIFKILGALLDAILPLVTTYFAAKTTTALVDAYNGDDGAGSQALIYVGLTALFGLLLTSWKSIDNYVQAKMRYVVEAAVSDRMYSHFLNLDFWQYDDKETADLYDRAIQFSQFFAWVFDRLATIMSQLIAVISALVALSLFQPILALCIFIAILPGMYLQLRLSRKQVAHWNENVEVRRSKSMLEWHLSQPKMIAELRLYGMVDFLLKHRRKLRNKDEQGRIEFEKSFLPLRLASDALQAITELGSLIWIVLQIIAGNQPVGQFLYVQQVVSRALQSATMFISTIAQMDEDIANLFDYEEFMKLPAGGHEGKKLTKLPDTITFNNVSFKYRGTKTYVLRNVSFTIPTGKHVAIIGENGAGKSTLIKLLAGLYKPTEGEILLDNVPLSDYSLHSWHEKLSVLQQQFLSYEFATARDNVRFGAVDKAYNDARFEDSLHRAEAKVFLSKLPNGPDTYVNNWMEDDKGNKGVALSGGQWQRLALARNFYRDTPIIILDEPTSAIDALAEERIFNQLLETNDKTIITISHRLSTIKKADIIYMFEGGKLIESGTHKELIQKNGKYVRMFKSQL